MLPGPEHRRSDQMGVPNFYRSANDPTFKTRVATAIVVRVFYAGPLSCRTVLLGHLTRFVELGTAQITGNIQHKGPPIEGDP